MLVLSRRLNQAIVIAGEVRVTVLAITPSRVELGGRKAALARVREPRVLEHGSPPAGGIPGQAERAEELGDRDVAHGVSRRGCGRRSPRPARAG